jgi:hypothetical protein
MNNMSVFTESKALRLANTSNPAYMVIDFIVCSDEINLNGEKLTKEGLELNAESLVDMPIQVDRYRLEKGLYSSLTHRAEKDGLKTDSVGVITKVWLETNDNDVTTMYASAKIWKRYKATCEALVELYAEDNLKFSWELVSTNWITAEDGTRQHSDFYFMGHCIVSMPSYPIAKAQLLVAELEQNSEQQSEVTGLEDNLVVELKEEELEVTAEKVDEVVSETEEEVVEAEKPVEEAEVVEDKVVEAEKVDDKEDKMIAYADAIATLTQTVATLQAQISELEPYRLEAVRLAEEKAFAETEARKAELKVMAERVVGELTAEMNEAIESQDEKALKLLIADFAIANVKESTSVVAEKIEDVIIATKDEEYNVTVQRKIQLV